MYLRSYVEHVRNGYFTWVSFFTAYLHVLLDKLFCLSRHYGDNHRSERYVFVNCKIRDKNVNYVEKYMLNVIKADL